MPTPYERKERLVASMQGSLRTEETSPLERALLLAQRAEQLTRGSQNPYQRRFYNFLVHCVWSVDEAKGGAVRRWPSGRGKDGRSWDRLWLEMEHTLLTERLLMMEKSRRVLASWTVCAWDIWLAAGGQDPRWTDEGGEPVLMASTGNRQVIVAARKAEGFGGSEWFIEQRIQRLLINFEAYGGRDLWPDFPRWRWKCGEIQFSNGSRITGVPQGSDQTRGGAATHLHCEEVAFWEMAAGTIGAAIPTMRGGGHITLVTTPQVGTYAQDIRDGTLSKR